MAMICQCDIALLTARSPGTLFAPRQWRIPPCGSGKISLANREQSLQPRIYVFHQQTHRPQHLWLGAASYRLCVFPATSHHDIEQAAPPVRISPTALYKTFPQQGLPNQATFCAMHPGQHHGHITGIIPWSRVILFITRLMLFVDNDKPQSGKWKEQRRPSTYHHPRTRVMQHFFHISTLSLSENLEW